LESYYDQTYILAMMGFISDYIPQKIRKNPIKSSIVAGAAVLVVAPALPLAPLGFLAGGVAKGSIAALVQSGIGNVAAGSAFAFCQSAAMGGAAATTISATAGGVAISTLFGFKSDDHGLDEETMLVLLLLLVLLFLQQVTLELVIRAIAMIELGFIIGLD